MLCLSLAYLWGVENQKNMEQNMSITIDGPAASGKSTVAQQLAKKLGYYYLNTGLLYRAVAYILMQQRGDGALNEKTIQHLTDDDVTLAHNLDYDFHDGKSTISYRGEDITPHLYTADIDKAASIVSTSFIVREALIAVQQAVAENYKIVADGRDCGTVVFPKAQYKFYLTADARTRAHRLMADDKRTYGAMDIEDVIKIIEDRDYRDEHRPIAPLRVPTEAVVIDNSDMTLEETVQEFLQYIKT
jgi:CMP/dCMP kinase